MTTEYLRRVTIAPCETLLYEANQLALCLAESADDDKTFPSATHSKGGNTFGLCSTTAKNVFLDMANSELSAPAHAPNVDLEAAQRAQALLLIGTLENPVAATPGKIAAIVGGRYETARQQTAALGLTRIPSTEEA